MNMRGEKKGRSYYKMTNLVFFQCVKAAIIASKYCSSWTFWSIIFLSMMIRNLKIKAMDFVTQNADCTTTVRSINSLKFKVQGDFPPHTPRIKSMKCLERQWVIYKILKSGKWDKSNYQVYDQVLMWHDDGSITLCLTEGKKKYTLMTMNICTSVRQESVFVTGYLWLIRSSAPSGPEAQDAPTGPSQPCVCRFSSSPHVLLGTCLDTTALALPTP